MTTWAHLPNAAVIDELIADAMARREMWHTVWDVTWDTAWERAWDVTDASGRGKARDAVRAAIFDGDDTNYATEGSACALIAWDSSADLLALTPDALRTIIATCDGDVKHQAVLLLPAVMARSTP